MVESPFVTQRRNRINLILETIRQAKPYANIQGLKSEAFDKLGISPKLIDQYIKDLVDMGKIDLDVNANTVRIRDNPGAA